MQYAVYQRRMLLEAMKNKALLLAQISDPEKASKTAQAYLEMAIPMSRLLREQRERSVQAQMEEIERMAPQHARAITTEEMMAKEGQRQAKAAGHTPPRAAVPALTAAQLAAQLNAAEAAKNPPKTKKPADAKPAPRFAPMSTQHNFAQRPVPGSKPPGKNPPNTR